MSFHPSSSSNEEERLHKIRQNLGNTKKKVIALSKDFFRGFPDFLLLLLIESSDSAIHTTYYMNAY